MTYRRPLVRPCAAAYAAALREARADLAQLSFQHECAMAALRAELTQVRADFEKLKDAVRRRVAAEQELELRRLRDIGRARLAQRDPATTPLH